MLKKVKNKATEIWDDHGDTITTLAYLGVFGYSMYSLGKFTGYLESLCIILDAAAESADK